MQWCRVQIIQNSGGKHIQIIFKIVYFSLLFGLLSACKLCFGSKNVDLSREDFLKLWPLCYPNLQRSLVVCPRIGITLLFVLFFFFDGAVEVSFVRLLLTFFSGILLISGQLQSLFKHLYWCRAGRNFVKSSRVHRINEGGKTSVHKISVDSTHDLSGIRRSGSAGKWHGIQKECCCGYSEKTERRWWWWWCELKNDVFPRSVQQMGAVCSILALPLYD